ncbi:MAG: hypothetical protein QM528_09470 [Phycisphaerales bacterium]|nr:hypothetical protein [Phycisphaerales bacterium]
MHRLFIFLLLVISTKTYAQTNFQWDVIIDSLNQNEGQLYSAGVLFITQNWPYPQNVVRDDDPAGGIILVKSVIPIQDPVVGLYNFSYECTLLFKDRKARIQVDHVVCKSAFFEPQRPAPFLSVHDGYIKQTDNFLVIGITEKQYLRIMGNLKIALQSLVDSYVGAIKKGSNW